MPELTTGQFLDDLEATFERFEIWAAQTGNYHASDALENFLSYTLIMREKALNAVINRTEPETFGSGS